MRRLSWTRCKNSFRGEHEWNRAGTCRSAEHPDSWGFAVHRATDGEQAKQTGAGGLEIMATNSAAESKQLLNDEVFQHIGWQIIDGTLAPGERIRDLEVATRLHVSRTPVREALQRLERLGLVTMYPNRYTEVTEVTTDLVAQSLAFAGYQAGIAARLAVPRLSAAQRTHVAALVEAMYDSLSDSVRTMNSRWAVFAYLGAHSDNARHCVVIEENTVALLRNLRNWTVPVEDRDRMLQVYVDLHDAVLRGDGDEAERLTREMHYV